MSQTSLFKSYKALPVTGVFTFDVEMLTYISGSGRLRFQNISCWVGLFFTNVAVWGSEKADHQYTSHTTYYLQFILVFYSIMTNSATGVSRWLLFP